MKSFLLLMLPAFCFAQIHTNDYPVYHHPDLGVHYNIHKTVFKVWAPKASTVVLRLYKNGEGGEPLRTIHMSVAHDGVWHTDVTGDIKNQYYTFQIQQDHHWMSETPDIYAFAVGVNGHRGMVVDLQETNPSDWHNDKRPNQVNFTDIIIYESHVRDLSISENSGIKHKGKFLGIAELNTKNNNGQSTGLSHLKELGITHLHLLPSFDYNTIDESKMLMNNYNWGYDPLNFNAPEGSYSTDPYNGAVRIKEFKQMVQALHANGIRVIMDVVYNHTSGIKTPFNYTAPGYYYRHNADGSYSDGSGCSNETASERPMMRKFIIESLVYWAKEYHIDGFRFDLMGLHDQETMNQISDTLHKIDPTIFIYGEGWTGGSSPLPEEQRAIKKYTYKLHKIAAFSDDMRDALRGAHDVDSGKGFVSGNPWLKESVKFGIVASTPHPQINYSHVHYSHEPWAAEPYQTINYVSCHDDNTLVDKLRKSNWEATEEDLIKMEKLSQSIVLTSQGVVFLHSGAELLRTKQGIANSYNLPDSINEIDWSRKTKYKSVFDYYQSMISLRKNHPAFRMPTTKMIQDHLHFTDYTDPSLLVYTISNNANGDSWKDILVVLNGENKDKELTLPAGKWTIAVDGVTVKEEGIKQVETILKVPAISAMVLFRQ
jgi:pullulanase